MIKNVYDVIKLILWIVSLGIILLIGSVTLTAHHSTHDIKQWLMAMSLPLTLIRCAAYLIIFILWPRLMHYLAKRKQWNEQHLAHVLAQRYKVLIWFMLFELIFAQNVIGQIIHYFI